MPFGVRLLTLYYIGVFGQAILSAIAGMFLGGDCSFKPMGLETGVDVSCRSPQWFLLLVFESGFLAWLLFTIFNRCKIARFLILICSISFPGIVYQEDEVWLIPSILMYAPWIAFFVWYLFRKETVVRFFRK